MQPIVTSFCFEGPRRSVRSRGLGTHVDDDVAEQTGTKNSKMTKSSGIVMQNWESRNSIHNATSDQVRAAVLFLYKWIAKNLSEDAVRVTSLDNENHNHYTVDVIAPNHALSLPIYIGVNCSANQLSNQGTNKKPEHVPRQSFRLCRD